MTCYIIAEYIWLDADKKLRSKTKIIRPYPDDNKNYSHFYSYPKWDYDGSSTGQADGHLIRFEDVGCQWTDDFRREQATRLGIDQSNVPTRLNVHMQGGLRV